MAILSVYIPAISREKKPRVCKNTINGAESLAESELQSTTSSCPGYRPPSLDNDIINENSHMQVKQAGIRVKA
jgi:hypothetical protein